MMHCPVTALKTWLAEAHIEGALDGVNPQRLSLKARHNRVAGDFEMAKLPLD